MLLATPGRAEDVEPIARFRRPVAIELADDDRLLLVANRRAGSVSTVDLATRRVVAEAELGRQLSDLEALPDGKHLVALDEAAHELILLERDIEAVRPVARLAVSPYPVTVAVAPDGAKCYVASLWSRKLSIVDLTLDEADSPELHLAKSIELPFAPREQLLVKGGAKLIVADAFGGRLAIVDMARGEVELVRELPAHNIRGLAVDPAGEKLLVAHQIINSLAETSHNDVHWGIVLSNVLRWLVLDNALSAETEILAGSHVYVSGDSSGANGDPAGMDVTPNGTVVLALAGIHQAAFGQERDYTLAKLPVGRRPTAVTTTRDGRLAIVANTFDDSLTTIDLVAGQIVETIPLGAMPEPSPADEGELLFYDARLSLDGWFSCHSCHTDGHTVGLTVDNLGDARFGLGKRVLSLLGSAEAGPWGWTGTIPTLEDQITKSVRSTMQGQPLSRSQTRALAAYLTALSPPPPLATFDVDADPAAVSRGQALFDEHGCANCHRPPEYTSTETYDVGLSDPLGNTEFNPPSLLGVSQGGPFFHDNTAATLDEVIQRHHPGVDRELTPYEIRDLVAFLRTL